MGCFVTKANSGMRLANAPTHGAGGVQCCYCRCCTCIHIEFLKTLPGMVKVIETVLSGFIQSLLITYGLPYSSNIGSAFEGALTTASACFLTSSVLLFCYVISEKSYKLIKQSLFELLFNTVACFMYLSSASYLAFSTKTFLWAQYMITPGFIVYPAMSLAYTLSGLVGLVHGADAYYCYQSYKGR